ncbi:MAG: polysaccharide biosynthesis tyrosine autokinase [Actinobacteria bacterium]|nr:polysaccharide biosynthesis tyrosine autokinase [Actinomycetota bacterium]
MQSVEKEPLPASSFMNILFRRGWYIVLCLVAVLVPVTIYNQTATLTFEAVSTIIYEEPHLPVNDQLSNERRTKESLVNQIQEINSRAVAQEVAKALPEYVKKKLPIPENLPHDFNYNAYYAAYIRSNLDAVPVAESDVIKIKAQANDAFTAMTIANTVCDVLSARNLRIRKEEVSGVRALIEEQQKTYRQKLEKAESDLRNFKVKSNVTSLDEQVRETLSRVSQIDVAYQQAKAERKKTEEQLRAINKKISESQKNLVPSITDVSTQLVRQMKNQLVKTRDQYTQLLLQGVPENNPKMVQMRADVDRIRGNLTDEARRIAEADNIIDPLSQMSKFFGQKVDLELQVETLRSQEQSLANATAQYERSLRRLPGKEFELVRLTRERDLANNIYTMLSQQREVARINEAEKRGSLRVIDRASLPKSPVRPRKRLNLAIGLLLGLTMGLGLAFFLESLDTSIKTPEEVEKKTGLTILGSIPRIRKSTLPQEKSGESKKPVLGEPSRILITYSMPASPPSEAYRTLRTNLQFSDLAEGLRSVIFTSSGPREGKSTTVSNLAIATAQMGLRTLVIDADLRRPTIHHLFSLHREPGLSDILLHFYNNGDSYVPQSKQRISVQKNLAHNVDTAQIDNARLSEAPDRANRTIQKMASLDLAITEAVQLTPINKLEVLTCGVLPSNPSEVLASETMKDLLALVKQRYEFVVIDAPPIIAVTDAAVLAPHVDGLALIIESGRNDKEIILKAKNLLDRVGVNIVGAILNNVHEKNLYGDYNYYYTYYAKAGEENGKRKKSRKSKG